MNIHQATTTQDIILTPPAIATVAMLGAAWLLTALGLMPLLAVIIGWPVYLGVLTLAGGFRGEDMALIGEQLPLGRLRRVVARGG